MMEAHLGCNVASPLGWDSLFPGAIWLNPQARHIFQLAPCHSPWPQSSLLSEERDHSHKSEWSAPEWGQQRDDDTLHWPWGQGGGTSMFWESHSLQREKPRVQVTHLRGFWLPRAVGTGRAIPAQSSELKYAQTSLLPPGGGGGGWACERLTSGAEATWFWSSALHLVWHSNHRRQGELWPNHTYNSALIVCVPSNMERKEEREEWKREEGEETERERERL
jgi:hypothetical protein